MPRIGVLPPGPPLLIPPALIEIGAGLDKGEKLALADQLPRGFEGGDLDRMRPVFIVPSIPRIVHRPPQDQGLRRHRQQGIGRRLAGGAAGRPVRMRSDVRELMLTDEYRRGFEMDELMLDAHQDDPDRMLHAELTAQIHMRQHGVDTLAHLIAIVTQGGDLGPVIVPLIEIVPAHLIDTDGAQPLDFGVDTRLDEAGEKQLVDEEGRRMTKIEDQRMAQRNRLDVVSSGVGEQFEERFIAIETSVKIAPDLSTQGLTIHAGQTGGTRKEIHGGSRKFAGEVEQSSRSLAARTMPRPQPCARSAVQASPASRCPVSAARY